MGTRGKDLPRFGDDPESALLCDRAALAEQRAAERARLGFDPAEPVGLVLFGGEGSAVMDDRAPLPDRQLLADMREERQRRAAPAEHAQRRADVRRRIHQGGAAIHAARRLLHRQAGPGEHQRGGGDATCR